MKESKAWFMRLRLRKTTPLTANCSLLTCINPCVIYSFTLGKYLIVFNMLGTDA